MKMTSLFIATGLALSWAALAAPPSDQKQAAENPAQKASEKPAAGAKRDHYPLIGEVVSISDTVLVLKAAKGKEDRKYAISAETKIVKDDKPATIKDATVGQRVTGSVHRTDKGNPQLVSLNLSPKLKEKIAEANAGEKKSEVAGSGKKTSS